MGKSALALSLEAIFQQNNSQLFAQLTEAFDKVCGKSSRVKREDIESLGIGKIIKENTNLNMVLFGETGVINAGVCTPRLTASNPLYGNLRQYGSNHEALLLIHEAKKPIKGAVDLKKSWVTGVFAEMEIGMTLGTGLMEIGMTGAQVASIVLHEIGHVFSYLEFLTATCTMNLVLLGIQKAYLGKTSAEEKVVLLKAIEDTIQVDLGDKDALATDNETSVALVVAKKYVESFRSANGSGIYDDVGWEFAADQFAQRHGAGKDLVIAQNMMDRALGSADLMSSVSRFVLQVNDLIEQLFYGIFTGFLYTILMAMCRNPLLGTYDRDGYRIERLIRQEMERLKADDLSPALRKTIVENLDIMRDVRKQYKEFDFIFDKIFVYLLPSRNAAAKEKERQQILEYLGTSDLLLVGSRFKNL